MLTIIHLYTNFQHYNRIMTIFGKIFLFYNWINCYRYGKNNLNSPVKLTYFYV